MSAVAGFLIRRAIATDARSLAELGARTFVETFGSANRREDIDAYLATTYGELQQRREIDDPRTITLIAEQDGALIGYAQLRTQAAGKIEIARFYVDRPWQGQGVAQTLMQVVIEEAKRARGELLWLGVWERNDRAIAFYSKCGFRDSGSQPFLLGSDLQTDRVMVRSLN